MLRQSAGAVGLVATPAGDLGAGLLMSWPHHGLSGVLARAAPMSCRPRAGLPLRDDGAGGRRGVTVRWATRTGGVELLERAMGYTLGGLLFVTPEAMSNRTPCAEWDLRALLLHMNDSLLTLDHAIARGRVDLRPVTAPDRPGGDGDAVADPVASLRDRACRMIGSWAGSSRPGEIAVAGRALPSGVVAATGALEVAVHGWDVARACGRHRPIPHALAEDLLGLARVLIGDADRPHSFGAPVGVPPGTGAGDRLLAVTGRDPATHPGDGLR